MFPEQNYTQALHYHENNCLKHDFYIDFEKLDWQTFIISPKGYNAFHCFGRCHRNEKNLPNQAKISNNFPEFQKKPLCCVPLNYVNLPIMFYDKNGNIAIKNYPEMIISQCGCR